MTVNKNRPTGRQSRWGICTNPNCPNYRQKIEIERGELICPEESCKKPLSPCAPPKTDKGPNWKKIAIIAAVVVVLAGAGFGIYSLVSGGQKIDKIKLKPKNLTMVVGQRDVIKATVVDKDGKEITDAKVVYKWTVKDEEVASVTQGGEVAALKKGKTSITVKIEGDDTHRATCQVEVKGGGTLPPPPPPLIKTIAITDGTSVSLKKGNTKQLQYQATPEPNSETPVWVSSDASVATVDATGLVTAVKEGTAQISVKAKNVASAPVTVTVTEEKSKEKEEEKPTTSTQRYGTVTLGYGTYTGDLKNGKPHGHGTITYKKSRRIVSWSDEMASPGDKFEGDFRDGVINGLGYLKTRDGNVIAIQ